MGKKYTADTFEGAVTGTASGNVAKTGDTMTGTLTNTASNTTTRINNTNAQTGAGMLSFQADSGSITDKFVFSRSGSGGQQGSIEFNENSGTSLLENTLKFKLNTPGAYTSNDILDLSVGGGSSPNNRTFIKAHKPIIAADGVYIGASSVSSSHHLDDYEEGSYNVQFFVSSGLGNYGSSNWVSGGGTAWTDNSQYVKVGRKVTLFFDLEYKGIPTSIATTSAVLYLTNLPFTMAHGGGGNISFSWYNRNASSNANPQDLGGATRLTGNTNSATLLKLEHLEYSSYWNAWTADSMQTNYLPTTPPGGNIEMRGQFTYFTDN